MLVFAGGGSKCSKEVPHMHLPICIYPSRAGEASAVGKSPICITRCVGSGTWCKPMNTDHLLLVSYTQNCQEYEGQAKDREARRQAQNKLENTIGVVSKLLSKFSARTEKPKMSKDATWPSA